MGEKTRLSVVKPETGAPSPGKPSMSRKKTSKQEAILREAAGMFNELGVGSVGFADLAKRMGVGRATFYHYVADREDLIFRCYQKSCEADTEHLDQASESPAGLEQVLEYLRLSLSPEADQTALITDTGVLSEGPRAIINKARYRNYERLAAMIGEGIDQGNIRPCDERVIARILPSMVAFARMSHRWAPRNRRARDVDALVDFVKFGSAARRGNDFRFYKNADEFSRISVSGFGDQSTADLRIEQILMKGSQLINLHGVENISLDDVAHALSATRGTVYHYFRDREDLVQCCLERSYSLYSAFIDYAVEHGHNGLEKAAIVSHLNTQAMVGPLQPVAGWMGLDVLSPAVQRKVRKQLRELLGRTYEFATEGMKDGSRRDHDFEAVTLARAGAYLWIPKWISDLDDPSPYRIADEVVALFNDGLSPFQ